MNQLIINQEKCSSCGTCEISLPDLLTKAKDNVLFISATNLKAHATEIYRAIFSCQNKAISLAGLGLPLPAVWRDADNNDMAVTGIMDLLQIAGAMAYQTQTAYGISWTLKAQVDAATTAAELEAVVWP